MILGFAAFSSTLNISSSVIVSPNSEDFKVLFCNSNTLYACNSSFSPTEKYCLLGNDYKL